MQPSHEKGATPPQSEPAPAAAGDPGLFFRLPGSEAEPRQFFPNPSLYLRSGLLPVSEAFTTGQEMTVLGGLLGRRAVLLAESPEHANQLNTRIAAANNSIAAINMATGIELPACQFPEILFFDAKTKQVSLNNTVNTGALEERLLRAVQSIELNHLSTFLTDAARPIAGIFPALAPVIDALQQQAKVADHFSSKLAYIEMMQAVAAAGKGQEFPLHVPTLVITPADLMRIQFEDLQNRFKEQFGSEPERLFVKQAEGSGGLLSFAADEHSFIARRITLEHSVKKLFAARSELPCLLVQEALPPVRGTERLPTAIGVNAYIAPDGSPAIIACSQQIYSDADCLQYTGSVWSQDSQSAIIERIGNERLLRLINEFGRQGYRGPFNLDFVQNSDGDYVSIYDMNPRLTGAFPFLATRHVLTAQGLEPQHICSLKGTSTVRFAAEISVVAESLRRDGLLYTRESEKGVLLIPTIATNQPGSLPYNISVINCSTAEASAIIYRIRDMAESHSVPATLHMEAIYEPVGRAVEYSSEQERRRQRSYNSGDVPL